MKTKLSEEMLSEVFFHGISNGQWAEMLPPFTRILAEMDCQQGRPDFVASSTSCANHPIRQLEQIVSVLATPSGARVLSLLKYSSPCSEDDLYHTSGYSPPVIRRHLRYLESLNWIIQVRSAEYVLSPQIPSLEFGNRGCGQY